MNDQARIIYPPEEIKTTSWVLIIRNWLIELLAGEKSIILNIKLSIVNDDCEEAIGLHIEGLGSGLLKNVKFDLTNIPDGKIYKIGPYKIKH